MEMAEIGSVDADRESGAPDAAKTKDIAKREELMKLQALKYKSLHVLGADDPVRIFFVRLVRWRWFDRIILMMICFNCVLLAMQSPEKGPAVEQGYVQKRQAVADFTAKTELFFTIAFTVEAVSKMVAWGVIGHPGAYLRDAWNWLDFIVVVLSIATLIWTELGNFSAVRTVRVLRPLRTMSRIPGMSVIVNAMLKSLEPLWNVVVLCVVLFFVFGILGIQFWNQVDVNTCGITPADPRDMPISKALYGDHMVCAFVNASSKVISSYKGAAVPEWDGSAWRHPVGELLPGVAAATGAAAGALTGCHAMWYMCYTMGAINFDNIGWAVVAIFQTVTLEGWTDIMYETEKLAQLNCLPPVKTEEQRDASAGCISYWIAPWVYFLLLIFFAGLFVVNLALAVIADSYAEATSDQDELDRELEEAEKVAEEMREQRSERTRQMSMSANGQRDGLKGPASLAHMGEEALHKKKPTWSERLGRSQATMEIAPIAACRNLVTHKYFMSFIMGVIGVNTILLALDQHDDGLCTSLEDKYGRLHGACMDQALVGNLEDANFYLTIFFACEMALKLVGLGLVEYWADSFNRFDAVIVIISCSELVLTLGGYASGGGGWFTVLRAGRLFRVFKLARSWGALRKVLDTVKASFGALFPLSIILMLFMFIYSLLGMQLYGGFFFFPDRGAGPASHTAYASAIVSDCNQWETCKIPRANFDSFGSSLVSIFQMMTGEDWNVIMYDGVAANGWSSVLYFFVLVVVGNYMVLNLFLAILLAGFGEQENENDGSPGLVPTIKNLLIGFFRKVKKTQVTDLTLQPERESSTATTRTDEDGKVVEVLQGKSFLCLKPSNVVRRKLHALVQSPSFENIILLCIVTSTFLLSSSDPYAIGGPYAKESLATTLAFLDNIFLVIFTIEFLIKHVVYGVIVHDGAYWRDGWNILDGTIVLFGYVSLLAGDNPKFKALRSVRAMRALRPLRAVRRFPGMKLAVNCLLKSLPLMLPMTLVCMLFFLVFAILGLQLFAGTYWSCDVSEISFATKADAQSAFDAFVGEVTTKYSQNVNETLPAFASKPAAFGSIWFVNASSAMTLERFVQVATSFSGSCTANGTDGAGTMANGACPSSFCEADWSFHGAECSRRECLLMGGSWGSAMSHFDHIGAAMLALFEASTTEGWPAIMWSGADAVGVGMQPKADWSFNITVFFVIWLVVGNFFVLNLYVGAVIDEFLRLEESAAGSEGLLTPLQKEWVDTQKKMLGIDIRIKIKPPKNAFRYKLYKLVGRPDFDFAITVVIVVNIVVLAMKTRDMSEGMIAFASNSNMVFTYLFVVEAVLKLAAWGPFPYFRDWWNVFDFFLVVVSLLDQYVNFGGFATFFRVFRVARVVRVARSAQDLRRMMSTIIISIPALGNVGSLLFILFFVYSVLGVQFFYEACTVPLTVAADPCAKLDPGFFWRADNTSALGTGWNFSTQPGYGGFGSDGTRICHPGAVTVDTVVGKCCARTHDCDDDGSSAFGPYDDCVCNEGHNVFANFGSFGTTMLLLVRMSTGEYWNGIMHDLFAYGELIGDPNISVIAIGYFFSFLMLSSFIMLNLVIAVLIINYNDSVNASTRIITPEHMANFKATWETLDEDGIGWMQTSKLQLLLDKADAPLGFNGPRKIAMGPRRKALQELARQLPDHDGMIHYTETLFALAYRNQPEEAVVISEPSQQRVALEIEKAKNTNVNHREGWAVDQPRNLDQTVAAMSFQQVFRSYQERKRVSGAGGGPDVLQRKLKVGGPDTGPDTDRSYDSVDSARGLHSYRASASVMDEETGFVVPGAVADPDAPIAEP